MAMKTTLVGGFPKIGDRTEEQKLRKSFHQFDKDELSEEALEQVKDEVTEEVIQLEEANGIDLLTDGLIRWEDPLRYFVSRVSGFELSGLIRYFDTNTFYRQPVCESRLETIKPIFVRDFEFARGKSSKPVRVILPGPFTIAKLSVNHFYKEQKQFVFDLAHLIHKEALQLEEAGCEFIQFDEPALLSHKEDIRLFFDVYRIVTAQLSKSEKTIFFNFGNIQDIYPKILDLPVERLGFDLTQGHPNWEVLAKAKMTKKLMAGIIDSRNTKMEREADLLSLVGGLGSIADPDETWLTHNYSLEFLPRENAIQKIKLLTQVASQQKGAGVS